MKRRNWSDDRENKKGIEGREREDISGKVGGEKRKEATSEDENKSNVKKKHLQLTETESDDVIEAGILAC